MVNMQDTRLNITKTMKNGQKATVIVYRSSRDIDVQFEDGHVERNKKYADFERGNVTNSAYHKNSKKGMSRKMNNGQLARIIEYRTYRDIDIQFEDGTVVTNKQYFNFLKGSIRNPNAPKEYNSFLCDFDYEKNIGEARIMNNGQTAKIIRIRDYGDLDVIFEDETVVTHKSYLAFKKGDIRNPNYKAKSLANKRLGMSQKMNNGQTATIIGYRTCHDIDVVFEDGTVIRNRHFKEFRDGYICNPNFNPSNCSKKSMEKERLGMVVTMKNGHSAKIISYRNTNDITVEFEDKTVVTNVTFHNFLNGLIRKPERKKKKRK